MYEKFYRLKSNPFAQTCDKKYMLNSQSFLMAKLNIRKMLDNDNGFILMTGDCGIGKTTLYKSLEKEFENINFKYLHCSPELHGIDLLHGVQESLKLINKHKHPGYNQIRKQITDHIIETAQKNQKLVLFIDEAQHLSIDDLETIRLLSNIECESKKLIHIILAGHHNLRYKLCSPELRQLRQRLSQAFELKGFTNEEVNTYIKNSIEINGGTNSLRFSDEAIETVCKYANGNPMSVNFICQKTLIESVKNKTRLIPGSIVSSVVKNMSDSKNTHPLKKIINKLYTKKQ